MERWIPAALRICVFHSLAVFNGTIDELLERLNARPFRKVPGRRRLQFEALDRPALRPLPAMPQNEKAGIDRDQGEGVNTKKQAWLRSD